MPGGSEASACQTRAGSRPEINRSARAMSRSRLIPGKTTTADFIAAGKLSSSAQFDSVIFDHGIGQELLGGAFERCLGAGPIRAFDFDVKDLALPHAGHSPDAKRAQRPFDGLALWIENTGLERDSDARLHSSLHKYESAPPQYRGPIRGNLGKSPAPATALHGFAAGSAGDGSSAFDQDRSGALRPLALAHDAKPFGNFGIGFDQSAQIAPEAVFVELFVRLDIPQPARVRRNLVRHDDAHQVIFPQPAGLHLKID